MRCSSLPCKVITCISASPSFLYGKLQMRLFPLPLLLLLSCFTAVAAPPPLTLRSSACTSESPCQACQGNCDTDADCVSGLQCMRRSGQEYVPGCGYQTGVSGQDYCHMPACPLQASTCESNGEVCVWQGIDNYMKCCDITNSGTGVPVTTRQLSLIHI